MTKQNESYDLVITGGRVMDPETGLDAVRNVGVKGGKIDIITEQPIQGKETIDATGHVVAPGFIDGHIHTVDIPLAQKIALRDGVMFWVDRGGRGFDQAAVIPYRGSDGASPPRMSRKFN